MNSARIRDREQRKAEKIYNFFLKKYKYLYNYVKSFRTVLVSETLRLKCILHDDTTLCKSLDKYNYFFNDIFEYAELQPLNEEMYQLSQKAGEIDFTTVSWSEQMNEIIRLMSDLTFDSIFAPSSNILAHIVNIERNIVRGKYGSLYRGLELTNSTSSFSLPTPIRTVVSFLIDSAFFSGPEKLSFLKCSPDVLETARVGQVENNLEDVKSLIDAWRPDKTASKSTDRHSLLQSMCDLHTAYTKLSLYVTLLNTIVDAQSECIRKGLQMILNENPNLPTASSLAEIIKILSQFHEFVKKWEDDDICSKLSWVKQDANMRHLSSLLKDSSCKVRKRVMELTSSRKLGGGKLESYEYGFFTQMRLISMYKLLKNTDSLRHDYENYDIGKYYKCVVDSVHNCRDACTSNANFVTVSNFPTNTKSGNKSSNSSEKPSAGKSSINSADPVKIPSKKELSGARAKSTCKFTVSTYSSADKQSSNSYEDTCKRDIYNTSYKTLMNGITQQPLPLASEEDGFVVVSNPKVSKESPESSLACDNTAPSMTATFKELKKGLNESNTLQSSVTANSNRPSNLLPGSNVKFNDNNSDVSDCMKDELDSIVSSLESSMKGLSCVSFTVKDLESRDELSSVSKAKLCSDISACNSVAGASAEVHNGAKISTQTNDAPSEENITDGYVIVVNPRSASKTKAKVQDNLNRELSMNSNGVSSCEDYSSDVNQIKYGCFRKPSNSDEVTSSDEELCLDDYVFV